VSLSSQTTDMGKPKPGRHPRVQSQPHLKVYFQIHLDKLCKHPCLISQLHRIATRISGYSTDQACLRAFRALLTSLNAPGVDGVGMYGRLSLATHPGSALCRCYCHWG
jgi:hypothetical protein